tara:strand:+ start:16702 stop:17217 length:516 start_codon:yes stop_codon:yes gene_type:complete
MRDVLSQIISSSYWELPIFGGKVQIRGRILSPSEAEQAGVMQFMVAGQLMRNAKDIKNMEKLQSAENGTEEERIDSILEATRQMGFRPEMLAQIHEQNNKIVSQVVRECSIDQGATWEKIKIVLSVDQQDENANRLWIGTIPKEDIESILEKALNGYKEGSAKIEQFFRQR